MRKLIIAVLLLISTLTYSQTYSIILNQFPSNTDTVVWCGTEDLDTRDCAFEILYCTNCTTVFVRGHIIYRKYYNSKNKKQIYWDIDSFTDKWNDPFGKTVEILGFNLDE